MSETLNRVDQLNGAEYDEDIQRLLFRQFLNSFPQHLINKYAAEMKLIMDYLFYRFTSSRNFASPGNQMFNVHYHFTSQRQRIYFMFFSVFLPYLSEKLHQMMIDRNWSDPALKTSPNIKDRIKYWTFKVYNLIMNLVKFLTLYRVFKFLWDHSFRNKAQLFLGIPMKRFDPNQERFIYFEYANRLIVWNAISTAMQNILPFVDFSRLRNLFEASNRLTEMFTLDDNHINSDMYCKICGTTQPCLPYETVPCGHIFCYYCARSKMQECEDSEEGNLWKCQKSNSKESNQLSYNNLPMLVEKWDLAQELLQRSALNNQLEEIKVFGDEGGVVLKHHMSNEFDSFKNKKRILSQPINDSGDATYLNSQTQDEDASKLELVKHSSHYQANGRDDASQLSINNSQYVSANKFQSASKAKIPIKNYKDQIKRSSIAQSKEYDDQKQYPNLYHSNYRASVTSFGFYEDELKRTESFKQNVDDSELRQDSKKFKNMYTTQKPNLRKQKSPLQKKGPQMRRKTTKPAQKTQEQIAAEREQQIRLMQERKRQLDKKKKEREEIIKKDNFLKVNRLEMTTNVCSILIKHIEAAEKFLPNPTQGALLFHQHNFERQEWIITTTSGYSSTMPLFLYSLEEIVHEIKPCRQEDLMLFMRRIFDKMQLANECIIISLIYLEKVMMKGHIEIRYCNWKPLFFTAILCASKFWEDICFWNVDYVDALNMYPLKSINRMESEFVSLCQYNLFVSAEMYTQYYIAVKEINNPVLKQTVEKAQPFNRFKTQVQHQDNSRILIKDQVKVEEIKEEESFLDSLSPNSKLLPVVFRDHSPTEQPPQYPSITVNMGQYKEDINEIIEESQREQREQQQTEVNKAPDLDRKKSIIGKFINPLKKVPSSDAHMITSRNSESQDKNQKINNINESL